LESVMLQKRSENLEIKTRNIMQWYRFTRVCSNAYAHSMQLEMLGACLNLWFIDTSTAHLIICVFFRFQCKRFRFYKFWTSLFQFLYYFRFENYHHLRFS